jgi:hypothetical protein
VNSIGLDWKIGFAAGIGSILCKEFWEIGHFFAADLLHHLLELAF